jgi:pimeloyl-ACP methyl ester carboxylesterase
MTSSTTDPLAADLYLDVGDVRLHVVAVGPEAGPLVVLLHGFPEFWFGWRRQLPALAAAGYRVLAPDQRGYNLSDKPRGVAAYALERLAGDVLGLIRAVGREEAILIGHDWGAAVAWWVAARHPERVHKLVILNVPHPQVMRRALRRRPEQLLRSWYVFFVQLPWLPEALLRLGRWAALRGALTGSSRPGTFDGTLPFYSRAWSQPGALTAALNWYRAAARHPPSAPKPLRVRVPTLILWGERDRFLSRRLAQPSLALCDAGELVFLDATHWVQHEEAERVNALMLEFLERR